jgi:hypothetical protein
MVERNKKKANDDNKKERRKYAIFPLPKDNRNMPTWRRRHTFQFGMWN